MAHRAYKLMIYSSSLSAVDFQARLDEERDRTSWNFPV
jgi:hypothetical protein